MKTFTASDLAYYVGCYHFTTLEAARHHCRTQHRGRTLKIDMGLRPGLGLEEGDHEALVALVSSIEGVPGKAGRVRFGNGWYGRTVEVWTAGVQWLPEVA